MSRVNSMNSNRRNTKKLNDSMSTSVDDFSDIAMADKSSRFLANGTSDGLRRQSSKSRNRVQLPPLTSNKRDPAPSVSIGTSSTQRSSMEEDLIRHWRPEEEAESPAEVPALESLFRQPKRPNATVKTEHLRMHRNTEVILGNASSPSSKKKSPRKANRRPGPNPLQRKLKMLNCFGGSGNSGKPKDLDDDEEEEGRRQRATIQEDHGHVVFKNEKGNSSKNHRVALSSNQAPTYECCDEDNYGETNSIAGGMNVVSMGSKECYREDSKSNKKNSNAQRSRNQKHLDRTRSNSSPMDILEELQEEEEELNSLNSQYERRSFINFSVSDIEEKLEKRDSTPSEEEDAPIQQRQQRRTPQKQQQQQQKQQQRIASTTSVVQGKVTPPRGPVSTSWMMRQPSNQRPFDEPSIAYHSVGSAMNTTSSTTTTSVINLAGLKEQMHPRPPKNLGPRCHFCGGDHWIYNCPHMDESEEGRRRRAGKEPRRKSNRRNDGEYEDDSYADDERPESLNDSLNTTMDTTVTDSSAVGCGTQSHPLQCRPCFKMRR